MIIGEGPEVKECESEDKTVSQNLKIFTAKLPKEEYAKYHAYLDMLARSANKCQSLICLENSTMIDKKKLLPYADQRMEFLRKREMRRSLKQKAYEAGDMTVEAKEAVPCHRSMKNVITSLRNITNTDCSKIYIDDIVTMIEEVDKYKETFNTLLDEYKIKLKSELESKLSKYMKLLG